MQSLVYQSAWNVSLEEKSPPTIAEADQVLVNIKSTGICGTDIGIISGAYDAVPGITLGHESTGIVESVGNKVSSVKVGDRVIIDPTYYCGYCLMCRTGRSNHCEQKFGTETGVSRDGTFSQYYLTQENYLYPLNNSVSFDAGTLTEPLSCALTGVNQLRTRNDLRTVILGAGPMGILYSHALATKGIGGAIVDISPTRLDYAVNLSGSRWRFFGTSLEEIVIQLSANKQQVDLIIDTTGVMASEAIPYLARGGQFLAVGLRQHLCRLDMQKVADCSLSIQGSIDSLGTFAAAAHLINSNVLPADSIVTQRLPLSEYRRGFQMLGIDTKDTKHDVAIEAVKVVLNP